MTAESITKKRDYDRTGLFWDAPSPWEPCEFRFNSDEHRDAAARVILRFYGDRECYSDPTSPDGRYHPYDLARRAINGWECAMTAAKHDRHRTADERARCLSSLATFEHYFAEWQEFGSPDAPLHFIVEMEHSMRGMPPCDIGAARARAYAEIALEGDGA